MVHLKKIYCACDAFCFFYEHFNLNTDTRGHTETNTFMGK